MLTSLREKSAGRIRLKGVTWAHCFAFLCSCIQAPPRTQKKMVHFIHVILSHADALPIPHPLTDSFLILATLFSLSSSSVSSIPPSNMVRHYMLTLLLSQKAVEWACNDAPCYMLTLLLSQKAEKKTKHIRILEPFVCHCHAIYSKSSNPCNSNQNYREPYIWWSLLRPEKAPFATPLKPKASKLLGRNPKHKFSHDHHHHHRTIPMTTLRINYLQSRQVSQGFKQVARKIVHINA